MLSLSKNKNCYVIVPDDQGESSYMIVISRRQVNSLELCKYCNIILSLVCDDGIYMINFVLRSTTNELRYFAIIVNISIYSVSEVYTGISLYNCCICYALSRLCSSIIVWVITALQYSIHKY